LTATKPMDDWARWARLPIKRFAELVYGDALPQETRDETGDVPVFGSNGAFGRHSEANTEAPTILVGRKGSYGALNWSDTPAFAIDTVYFIDRRHARCDLRWLFWALHTAGLDGLSQDTGVPGLSRETAYGARLPLPSLREQTAIAASLDRETGKIDALVEEQRRLMELLREKRQAVISHAVAKGLDPNAKMKPSGVDWLGDVPEHWGVARLKFVASVQTGTAKGKDNDGRDTIVVPYLRVANVQDGYIDLSDVAEIEVPASDLSRYLLRKGDVLMNEGGDFDKLGRGSIWEGQIDPCIHQNHVFAVRPTAVTPEWLNLVTGSSYAQFFFMGRSKQSTNLASISSTNVMELPITLPPPEERSEILRHVSAELLGLDALHKQASIATELLLERRSALISAAVTGKIDVLAYDATEVQAA